VTDPTREEALAHFGVKGQRWGVRKKTPTTSESTPEATPPKPKVSTHEVPNFPMRVIDTTNVPTTPRPPVPRPPSIAKPMAIFGTAVVGTVVVGLGAAYAANHINVNGGLKLGSLPKFHRAPKLVTNPDLIRTTSERVFPFTGRAISGGPKAIEALRTIKPKGPVYNLVSDKNVKRGADWVKNGAQYTNDVLIGTIGGISIADLKK